MIVTHRVVSFIDWTANYCICAGHAFTGDRVSGVTRCTSTLRSARLRIAMLSYFTSRRITFFPAVSTGDPDFIWKRTVKGLALNSVNTLTICIPVKAWLAVTTY